MKTQFKNSTIKLIMLLFICLGISSCSSDDSNLPSDQQGLGNGNPINRNENFSCSLDENVFVPINIIALKQENQESFSITTIDDQDNGVQLLVDSSLDPGTYAFDENIFGTVSTVNQYAITGHSGADGMLTILTHDRSAGTMKGTFSFNARTLNTQMEFVVTDGAFDVDYVVVE